VAWSCSRIYQPEPVLSALSGLAKAIMAQTGDQYPAGLWRSSLLNDISWQASYKDLGSDGIKTNRRPAAWRAPSWSWVSVEANIYFYENGVYPRANPPEIWKHIAWHRDLILQEN